MTGIEIKHTIKKIVGLAFPILTGNIIVAMASLLNMRILGKFDQTNLYILAVFAPIYSILLAFQESFRGTAIIVASHNKMTHIRNTLCKLIFLALVTGGIFACFIKIFSNGISIKLHVDAVLSDQFQWFIQEMGWINILLTLSVVLNAVILGAGFPAAAFTFTLITCLFTTSLLIFQLAYSHQGLQAFTRASFLTSIVVVIMMLLFLKNKQQYFKQILVDKIENTPLSKLVSKTGIPLFFSYVIIFGGFATFNLLLAHYGISVVSGYGIACRLQMLLVLPAIGIGTALAILVNNQITSDKLDTRFSIILVGMGISIILYGLLSELIYSYRNQIIGLFVSAKTIQQAAIYYYQQVAYSYVISGPMLTLLTMLEQIGYGLQVMLFNFCYFAGIGLAGYFLLQKHDDYTYFYKIISCVNCLSLFFPLIFASQLQTLFKRFKYKFS